MRRRALPISRSLMALFLLLSSPAATTGFLSFHTVTSATSCTSPTVPRPHSPLYASPIANGTLLNEQNSSNLNSTGVLLREPLPDDLPSVLNVLHKHNRINSSDSNGTNNGKKSQEQTTSLFDAQSLLKVSSEEEEGLDTVEDIYTPLATLKEVANTKASITSKAKSNKRNGKKPYNQNPKNSQEIIRTIHLRNFHREMEQVKLLELEQASSNKSAAKKLLKRYRPVLLSTLYAALVATTTSKIIQPAPAWTIAQSVLPQAPTLFQSLTTSTCIALTIPLAIQYMVRFVTTTYQTHQTKQTQQLALIQTKALARALYQSLDDVITKIPSNGSISAMSRGSSNFLPRPHPMLVSRTNNNNGAVVSPDASHQVEEILVAAKCLALVGYTDSFQEVAVLQKLLQPDNDRIAALLERIRQVTCRLKCRDLPSQYSWEERLFALETQLALLAKQQLSADEPTLGLQQPEVGLKSRLQRFQNKMSLLRRRVTRPLRQPSLFWMAVFPWCLAAHQLQPVAIVWSTAVAAILKVGGERAIEQQQDEDDGPKWNRQILDAVQQQMVVPTTTTTPQSNVNSTKETAASATPPMENGQLSP